ncbi:cytochrome b [Thalassotalea euphylliae]|uniref:cytochrome b n=1 Tax=Thalassotalea euphylliae TaxID=1655234 RepID=UPI00362FF67C
MIKDSDQQYGLISKLFHWLSALCIVGLFAAGWWMVELDYYSEWYRTAPHWHKSIGILLLIATIARIGWKLLTPSPKALAEHSAATVKISKLGHSVMYLLMVIIMLSGYLISTADGRGIEVFTWFEVPSLGELFENQEDIAGTIHEYLAYGLIGLAVLHALAALKHHFVDKDKTLSRMM